MSRVPKGHRNNSVRGMKDILPAEAHQWQKVESEARRVFGAYGFQELRPPIIEYTDVFVRSIGETSDIVEKEMYTFTDKGGRSMTLRPEGTASIVRCYVEKNLHTLPLPQKFYYEGPMFRYERPQEGRQRQFYQIGVEAFGVAGPKMDAEIIAMLALFLERVGLQGLKVFLNSIGCPTCRPGYTTVLKAHFADKLESLCEDCKRRYDVNPLRILDCKVPGCIELRAQAPLVSEHLCAECDGHFTELHRLLDLLGVPYELDPHIVRGLDYYTRTIFEVTSEALGAQNAVAAGGRYDNLVAEFGGSQTPAIGFAIGMERLVSLIQDASGSGPSPALFIASIGEAADKEALRIAGTLRAMGLWVELGYGTASLKSQMRRADRIGAAYAFIIGDEELQKGSLKWKSLAEKESGEILADEINDFVTRRFNIA